MHEQQTASGQEALSSQQAYIAPPGRWLIEGARISVFRRPRWSGLHATPWGIAALTAAMLLLNLLLDRLYIKGPADFEWQAVAGGWLGTAASAWVCYLMRPRPAHEPDADAAPSAAHLFAAMLAQTLWVTLAFGLIFIALIHASVFEKGILGHWGNWAVWLAPALWVIAAQLTLLFRSGIGNMFSKLCAALTLAGVTALLYLAPPAPFWHAAEAAAAGKARPSLVLTQEVMEAQPALLAKRLQALQPQRPGIIDLYVVSFAPYSQEDVFRREADMVAQVMQQRFDAAGRTLELINHPQTVGQWPWATPLNLKRTIEHIAQVIDREEDILFLHLTSHGAQNGELAADFWPMNVGTVKPHELKAWLDEAGIKNRVISISACFSGSWIAPLSDENTLVMTAADAEHTSYGCGRKSELTFFGRAMYDEQLRNSTLSFEEAHAAARRIIKQREEEAGKSDGYSNPQIKVGSSIQKRLASLRARLEQTGKR